MGVIFKCQDVERKGSLGSELFSLHDREVIDIVVHLREFEMEEDLIAVIAKTVEHLSDVLCERKPIWFPAGI